MGAPEQTSERKQVTVLFADVVRSMDLADQLDADELTEVMQGLFTLCRDAVLQFGGTVDKFTGDGVMALFGAPAAQEDHAKRACHAALRLLESAQAYAAGLRPRGIDLCLRVGLNSGEVVAGRVGGEAYTAVGQTVGLAQRVESAAPPGSACLSEHTARLVVDAFRLRPLGPTTLKGVPAPVEIFQLAAAAGGPASAGRRRSGSARLVGRAGEVSVLEDALADAEDGRARVLGIVGEAGAGKSRLCSEFTAYARARGVTVRQTAGVSHAQSVPLLPILGLFRDYFEIGDDDAPAIAAAKVAERLLALDAAFDADLGLMLDFLELPHPDRPVPNFGPVGRRRRILEVVRRITALRSERETLVLLFEDLHWFDPASVEFLADWLPSFPGSRTLVVTNFRPEFRAGWASAANYTRIPVAPLHGRAFDELVAELLGADPSVEAVRRQLRERAGGNPFFAEEIVRALSGSGTLEGAPGEYRLMDPTASITVPPTVQAVLADRIDRLPARAKEVLQAAAVIGRTFSERILAPVSGLGRDDLADALAALRADELILPDESGEHRFWHPLTQEVAYGTLVASARRRLHGAVAAALVTGNPDRLDELAALVATHFEAAADALDAGRWQLRAGTHAMRTDYSQAAQRWRAAIAHLDGIPETHETLVLGTRARTLLLRLGARTGLDAAEAERLFAQARPAAERIGDLVLLASVSLAEYIGRMWAGDLRGAVRARPAARRYADESGDPGLRAWILSATGAADAWVGPVQDGQRDVDLALELCGDDPTAGTSHAGGYSAHDLAHYGWILLCVPGGNLAAARSLVPRLLGFFLERPTTEWESHTLAMLAQIAYFGGDADESEAALHAAGRALRLAQDSGNAFATVRAHYAAGLAHLMADRPADAASCLQDALSHARKHRCGLMDEGCLLAHLALTHLRRDDIAMARASSDEALAVARRQGAEVVETLAHLTRAQVWRAAARSPADLAVAEEAVTAGIALATRCGAQTYAVLLAEERARLDDDPHQLALVIPRYDAIGATGHARRLRAELGD